MVEQLLAIFRNTFVESIRQPIYVVLLGVGVLALVLNLSLSAFTMEDDNKFLIDMGMATIFMCGLLIAAFTATSVLSGEIENKTVLTVVSKPVGRPLFIVGKYMGVSSAIIVAAVILSCAFLLTVRHEVRQTATDDADWPVIIYGLAAVLLGVGIGVWGNYFYGWVFSSTTVIALLPLSVLAWVGVLHTGKEWVFQGPGVDFRPNIMMALAALYMALMLMSAIAIAASARLGQVMTIFICVLVFAIGLLNDHLFGRKAFSAETIARLTDVSVGRDILKPGQTIGDFSDDGDYYKIRFDSDLNLKEGMGVLIAADPLGLSLLGSTSDADRVEIRNLTKIEAELHKVNDGSMSRPPRAGDYLFIDPPSVNPIWRVLWSIPPDLQFVILIDPLTQDHAIPLTHLARVGVYCIAYVSAMLCLAIILFQKREVG